MVQVGYRSLARRCLAAVAGEGYATAGAVGAALARSTDAEPLALLGALDAMVADGLVEVREPEDDAGGRRTYALTREGQERASATGERAGRGIPETALGSGSRATTPFVGREDELATLGDALETAVVAESPFVVVEGAPGAGKTRLVREAIDRLATDRADLVVAAGRGRPGPDEPFGAVRRALAGLPEVGSPFATGPEELELPVEPAELLAERTALFEAVADALRTAAVTRPVVVFVDDLQWIDPASAALLSHLARTVDDLAYPLAFVVAHRRSATADGADVPAETVLSAAHEARAVTTVSLEGLSRSEGGRLIAAKSPGASAERVFAVHEATGGLPAAVEHAVVLGEDATPGEGDDGDPTPADPGTPGTDAGEGDFRTNAGEGAGDLRALVQRRMAAAGDDVRGVLRRGAVLGDPISRGLLAVVGDLDDARRRECVDLLLAAGIWEPVEGSDRAGGEGGSGAGTTAVDPTTVPPDADLRFATPAVREAVLGDVPPDERREYRSVAADAEDEVHDEAAHDPARDGRHHEAADAYGTAVEWYLAAGDAALSSYAPAVAEDRYERALGAAGEAGEVDEALLAAVHGSLGDARRVLAAAADATETASTTADAGTAVDDDDRDRRGHVLRQLGDVARRLDDHDRAVELARRAVERGRTVGDARVEGYALNLLGTLHFERGERDAAGACFRRARDRWEALGDRQAVAENVSSLGIVAWQRGDYDRARELVERALEIDDADQPRAAVKRLNNLGVIAATQGDYEASREYQRACLDRLSDARDPEVESKVLNNLGEIARRLGEYDLARERYEESLTIKREIGDRRGEGRTLTNVARAAARRGAHASAREYLDESLEIAREVEDPRGIVLGRLTRGLLALAERRPERAAEQFRAALDRAADTGDRRNQARCRRGLGLAALERGDPDAAADHLEAAADLIDPVDDPIDAAKVRLARGRVALARDDARRARELAADASGRFRAVGATHRLGEGLLVLGRACRATGETAAALGALQTAVATLAAVDAPMDELTALCELVDAVADDPKTRSLCRRAERVLADAPAAVERRHGEWIRRRSEALDGEQSDEA